MSTDPNLNDFKKGRRKMKRKLLLFLIDFGCFVASYGISILIALCSMPSFTWQDWYEYVINGTILFVSMMAVRLVLKIYSNIWRHAMPSVYLKMMIADMIGGLIGIFVHAISKNRSKGAGA